MMQLSCMGSILNQCKGEEIKDLKEFSKQGTSKYQSKNLVYKEPPNINPRKVNNKLVNINPRNVNKEPQNTNSRKVNKGS